MKLTNWFLNFDFAGRARRSHMWANWASWMGVILIAYVIVFSATNISDTMGGITALILVPIFILSFIDNLAMIYRRAHDTGKSGWIWLLALIPLVNLLAFYWLYIEDSQQGPNKYGPPVKSFYEPNQQPVG